MTRQRLCDQFPRRFASIPPARSSSTRDPTANLRRTRRPLLEKHLQDCTLLPVKKGSRGLVNWQRQQLAEIEWPVLRQVDALGSHETDRPHKSDGSLSLHHSIDHLLATSFLVFACSLGLAGLVSSKLCLASAR